MRPSATAACTDKAGSAGNQDAVPHVLALLVRIARRGVRVIFSPLFFASATAPA
jgi:hypothetical protein